MTEVTSVSTNKRSASAAPVKRRKPQHRRPHGGKLLGKTLDYLDQRTNAFKRRQKMLDALVEEYGELTFVQKMHAENVVRLAYQIEELEVKSMKGETIDSDLMATLVREQSRELAALIGD